MSNTSSPYEKWLARMDYFRSEYPFGPFALTKNIEGRLHSEKGFAYVSPTVCAQYTDGRLHGMKVDIWGAVSYYYEGICVPRHYMLSPETLTVKEVLEHANAEVRYVGIKILGFDKVRECKNFKSVHTDTDRDGNPRELFHISKVFAEPLAFISVENSTPELDGHRKVYYLQVPPDVNTCGEAVAWTFRMEEKDYQPSVET
jgi:hypothetical protein